jgi:hypothetical protein
VGKVYSISDFKEGLDVRKTALTAPAGSLRILDNAWLTPGGEIEKRPAFVKTTTLPPEATYIFGQGSNLHVFGVGLGAVDPGTTAIPIVTHNLTAPVGGTAPYKIIDVESYDLGFYVIAVDAAGVTWIWWNGVIVAEVGGSGSRGIYARTYKTKMYRVDGRYLRFSGVNDPAQNDPANVTNPGAGFINVATHDPDGEDVKSLEVFYDKMVVFARLMSQLWTLDPDPTKDSQVQLLRIGTVASRSVAQFGTGDILFLSDSGIRSLKSQTVTTTAAVSDVGSAIDPLMTAIIRTSPAGAGDAKCVVQPIAGRYWLAIGGAIYVLSYFPAGHITAWSRFLPGFDVTEFAVVENRIFCRGHNPDQGLYLFGGNDNQTYDSCKVTVRTPHHDLENPTTRKQIQSVDLMCQGQWALSMGMLPNNVDAFEPVATIQDNTFGLQSIPFAGYGTHVGIELTHEAPGPAVLAAIHLNIREGSTK